MRCVKVGQTCWRLEACFHSCPTFWQWCHTLFLFPPFTDIADNILNSCIYMSPLYDGSWRVKEALVLQVHKKASSKPVWLSPNGKTHMWGKLLALNRDLEIPVSSRLLPSASCLTLVCDLWPECCSDLLLHLDCCGFAVRPSACFTWWIIYWRKLIWTFLLLFFFF